MIHTVTTSNKTNSSTMPALSYFKKFAKQIGSHSGFVQFSVSQQTHGLEKRSSSKLNAYEKLIKSVFKSNSPATKIPKSVSAPIDFNGLRVKLNSKTSRLQNDIVISQADNETYANENTSSVIGEPIETMIERSTTIENPIANPNPAEAKPDTKKVVNEFSVKTKLSRLFIGLGTYVVTCGGTNKSRQLAEIKYLKNNANGQLDKRSNLITRSFRRKKSSWLLLNSSETSLNTFQQ
jgi:hypothetical protein